MNLRFTQDDIDRCRLVAICRTDPDDFILRTIPPPPEYWRVISLVTDEILARKP